MLGMCDWYLSDLFILIENNKNKIKWKIFAYLIYLCTLVFKCSPLRQNNYGHTTFSHWKCTIINSLNLIYCIRKTILIEDCLSSASTYF